MTKGVQIPLYKIMYVHCIYMQDEFLDVLYWLRQVLCLVLGLVWGVIPLHGYVGMTL